MATTSQSHFAEARVFGVCAHPNSALAIVEVVGEEQHRGPQGELESLGVLGRSIMKYKALTLRAFRQS